MDSHTIENFGNKVISAIGAVLARQNRGPYTRNRVYLTPSFLLRSLKVIHLMVIKLYRFKDFNFKFELAMHPMRGFAL